MSVLNQPKKNQESLIAVSINDKLNTKHKKGNEYFKDDKQTYWIIDNNFQIPDFAYVLRRFFHKLSQPINVDINSFLKLVKSENVIGVINAFFSVDALATQKYSLKTKNVPKLIQHNFILDAKFYKDAIKVAQVLAEAEVFASELINMPGNILNADKFESICKNKFIGLKNVQLDVLHKNDLTQKKMGLILAVGQSSSKYNEPRIITAKYANGAKNKKTVALIGKGLMFDTGGLNLKPGEYMKSMHTDMAGAAISLATIYALAKLQIPANVTSIAAIASNEIGPSAYRVNDVIKSYSGATVEIMDTDAEGRLVLADAISYAKKDLKVDTVVTIATLTGSIMVALGHLYIGI
jgi:leucyl aminopeptidase